MAAYLTCLSAVVRYRSEKGGKEKKGNREKHFRSNETRSPDLLLKEERASICLVLGFCIVPILCLDRVCIVPSPRIWGCPLVDAAMVTSSTCHILHKVYRCTKLKWYFAIPNQKFKQWPNMAWRPYKSRAYHFIECNFHQVCFIPIFGKILQLGQDGPKIQLSLWVCDSFSWLWTFSLFMKHFLSRTLVDYHFPQSIYFSIYLTKYPILSSQTLRNSEIYFYG